MSKRAYFSQYQSPNIVIVPTVSLSTVPAKKTSSETQSSVEKMESGGQWKMESTCKPDKTLNVNSDRHPTVNCVMENVNNTVKEPIASLASNSHLSTSQISKKPMKLNVKENICTSQPLNVDLQIIKNKTVKLNMNAHSSETMNFMATDAKPLNYLCNNNHSNKDRNKYTLFSESNIDKDLYNNTNIDKYIMSIPHQVKMDDVKRSTAGERLKRKIADTDTKNNKKLKAIDVIDLNKNSDSDFEEQKYRTKNTKYKKLNLEAHSTNKDTSKTDIKKPKKLLKSKSHHKCDKDSNFSNEDSAKNISNVSTLSNKCKGSIIERKLISKSVKEKAKHLEKKKCDSNIKGKQATSKQDDPKPCLKKISHSAKVTPIKSVVQVTEYFELNTSKNQDQNEEALDLRTKINCKNQTYRKKLCKEVYLHSKHNQKKGQLNTRDNLRITVNNLNTQNDNNTKSPEKKKSTKCKSKRCKKIKLVINIICQKPLDRNLKTFSSETSNPDGGEIDSSYLLPTADLSFLDDINVDEIVESLKDTKNETDTIDNFNDNTSLSRRDLYKWDCSIKHNIKTEKANFVTKNDNFISNEKRSEEKCVNQTKNNESLSNVITPNNQIRTAKHTLAVPMYETHTVSVVSIKQETFENDSKQKEVEAFNINDVKEEDDAVSECSTVIIEELTNSDIGVETFENIDKSFIAGGLQTKYSTETEAAAIILKKVGITADISNEHELINVLMKPSNMTKQIDETPRLENKLVSNVSNDNKHETVVTINDNPTGVHVNNREILVDNNEKNLNTSIELDTTQSQANSEETPNISILNSIGKDLSIVNNKDVCEEKVFENNKEDFDQIKLNTKTTKEDVLDNDTASERQVVENDIFEAIGNACAIPSDTINNDNNLLPIASNNLSKEINRVTMDLDEECVNQFKTESRATVQPSVTETVAKKEITISPTVEEKMSFKSTAKQENKCETRSLQLVKALPAQDQLLAVTLEERMCSYLKTQYSVLSVIGKGKFSKIFRCQDTSGQNYAIKMLKNECDRLVLGYNKETMLMEIQKEVPRENLNTVYIINGFSLSGHWCFLMEYYPKNLNEALRENNKSFHIDIVQILARQLIAAVTILRNHNIIHSDIKPHHILINSTHNRLKLCGFDSSYYVDSVALLPNIGTASYRPPEVILGFSAGFSLDVWSTALVMYEMTTNTKLFPGLYNNDILYKQMCTFGNIPFDMLQRSLYKNRHFIDNSFIRKCGDMGQNFALIWTFNKSQNVQSNIMNSYQRDWGQLRSKYHRTKDMAKLKKFNKLLLQMLVLDPRYRLPIEFAYANPFIHEALT